MKMGNIMPRARIKPISFAFQASVLIITVPIFLDVTTLSIWFFPFVASVDNYNNISIIYYTVRKNHTRETNSQLDGRGGNIFKKMEGGKCVAPTGGGISMWHIFGWKEWKAASDKTNTNNGYAVNVTKTNDQQHITHTFSFSSSPNNTQQPTSINHLSWLHYLLTTHYLAHGCD